MAELGRSLIRWSLILLAFLQPLLLDWQNRAAGDVQDAALVRLVSLAIFTVMLWLGLGITGGFSWRVHPLRWPLAAWAVVVMLATALSVHPELALLGYFRWHDGALAQLLYIALLLALPAALERRAVSVRLLILLWLAAAAVNGLYVAAVSRGYDPLGLRLGAFMGNADLLAPYLAVPVLGGFGALVLGEMGWRGRVITGSVLAGFCWCFLAVGVRGAWLAAGGLLVGASLWWLVRRVHLRRVLAGWLILGVTCALFLAITPDIRQRLAQVPQLSAQALTPAEQSTDVYAANSGLQRIWIWEGVLRLVRQRPLLGWGPDTLMVTFSSAQQPVGDVLVPSKVVKAHNDYLEVLYGQGVLGLLAYLAVGGAWLATLWRRVRRGELAPWQQAAALGLLGAFASLAVEIANVRAMPSLVLLLGMTLVATSRTARATAQAQ